MRVNTQAKRNSTLLYVCETMSMRVYAQTKRNSTLLYVCETMSIHKHAIILIRNIIRHMHTPCMTISYICVCVCAITIRLIPHGANTVLPIRC